MLRRLTVSNAVFVVGAILGAACSRANVDAANLSNEGDSIANTNKSGAIAKYEQAIQLDPSNQFIAWKLGNAYVSLGTDWTKAATAFGKAEAAAEAADGNKKTRANYYFYHGYSLEQAALDTPTSASAWKDAQGPLKTATQVDPNYSKAFGELGKIALRLDDEAGALQNFTKAIEVKPNDLQYYFPLADLYRRLNFPQQEEQVVMAGLSYAKPGDTYAYNLHAMLASIDEAKHDLKAAIGEYEAAKKSCGDCTDHKDAYFNLAYAYASVDKKDLAAQNLRNFWKMTCKSGGAKSTFKYQCDQTPAIAAKVGVELK